MEKFANNELSVIKDYFDANGLTISTAKTSYMHFKPKGKTYEKVTLKIGDITLNEVQELTFLGVVIDKDLNFNSHFQKVYKKASHGLRGLILAKNFLTYKAKNTIYHSLIHSHISYCSIIWIDRIKKSQKNQLIKLQKKALRAVFNAKYNTHTSKFFQYSGITRVENIFKKESAQITHKFHNRSLPNAIQQMFMESISDPSFSLRSMKNCVLHPKRELIGTTIYKILGNWNSLGNSIREIKSHSEFKDNLTKQLQTSSDVECNKTDCFSCKFDFDKMETYIKY